MKVSLDGHDFDVEVEDGAVVVDGRRFQVSLKGNGLTRTAMVDGRAIRVDLGEPGDDGTRTANVEGKVWQARASGDAATPARSARPAASSEATAAPRATPRAGKGAVTAQMTGRVLRIEVKPGDEVADGALLLVLEAMKMENEIRAPRAGTIKAVPVSVGDRVSTGDPLVELQA